MRTSDFLDRLTILVMKARVDRDAARELCLYLSEMEDLVQGETWSNNAAKMTLCMAQLAEANAKTWVAEAAMRKEFESDPESDGDLCLKETGKRAIMIRGYNKLRVAARKKIDDVYGDLSDRKVDHLSS